MELSPEATYGALLALLTILVSAFAIFRLRAPAPEQPDPLAPHEPITAPPVPDPVPPTAEVLGLFADADGEMTWNYLDPARHTLFVRLRGQKQGKFFVGLAVDGRVGSTCTLTVGDNTPIEKIHSIPMEFPKYDRYRATGTHTVSVLTGPVPVDVDPRADPIWTDRVDYQVEVVQR